MTLLFEQAATERTAERHSNWPSELEILQSCADDATIRSGQLQQPLPYGFRTHVRAEENHATRLATSVTAETYQ